LLEVLRVATTERAPARLAPLIQPLEEAICEYARRLRDTGLPPEKVVIAIRFAAEKAGLAMPVAGLAAPLMETIVSRCIREYYQTE
jgi:hypothetical protein